MLVIMIMKSID